MVKKVSIATGDVCEHSAGPDYPFVVYVQGNIHDGTHVYKVGDLHSPKGFDHLTAEHLSYGLANAELQRIKMRRRLNNIKGALSWAEIAAGYQCGPARWNHFAVIVERRDGKTNARAIPHPAEADHSRDRESTV